jgi:hypothetical protein
VERVKAKSLSSRIMREMPGAYLLKTVDFHAIKAIFFEFEHTKGISQIKMSERL